MTKPSARGVTAILAAQLGVALHDVVPTASLTHDLRAPALAIVRVSLALEDAFGIQIPDARLGRLHTVEDVMAAVVESSRVRPGARGGRTARRSCRGRSV